MRNQHSRITAADIEQLGGDFLKEYQQSSLSMDELGDVMHALAVVRALSPGKASSKVIDLLGKAVSETLQGKTHEPG